MDNNSILSHVDHTLLSPTATWLEIKKLCEESIEYKTASICIPPSYIKRVKDEYGEMVNICTVIGFPLGYSVCDAKIEEVKRAIEDGSNELDMVINLGDVKNGDFDKITQEIAQVKKQCGGKILKVIIETCYLTENEKIQLCECVTMAKADYIKTSTGFGVAGATIDDILLFNKHIGKNVKIKAAGGIRTRDDMIDYISAGCERLGTSSAIKILMGEKTEDY